MQIISSKNYFEQVNLGYVDPQFSLEQRVDPDSCCESLYESMLQSMDGRILPSGNIIGATEVKLRSGGYYELIARLFSPRGEWLMTVGLGCDFIGPSTFQAQQAAVSATRIKDSLAVTRTLGGHMLWPRWLKKRGETCLRYGQTINQARGGKGLFDRFDLTLLDLQRWYQHEPCRLGDAFDRYASWLEQFVSFPGLVGFFKLEDFVKRGRGEQYWVYDLASMEHELLSQEASLSPSIPTERDRYELFMHNVERIVAARTNRLCCVA